LQILTSRNFGEPLEENAPARSRRQASPRPPSKTLAIILTSSQSSAANIEAIRGVACGETIRSLMKSTGEDCRAAEEPPADNSVWKPFGVHRKFRPGSSARPAIFTRCFSIQAADRFPARHAGIRFNVGGGMAAVSNDRQRFEGGLVSLASASRWCIFFFQPGSPEFREGEDLKSAGHLLDAESSARWLRIGC